MMKGIFTPLSGAVAQERVLEIIANNLANINTNAFKAENVSFTVLEPEPQQNYKTPIPPAAYKIDIGEMMPLRGNEMQYVGVAEVSRDSVQGPVIQTKNPLDLMIEGEGYFGVMTDEGMRYTRDGSFTLNSEGVLSNKNGSPVQGEKGAIYLRSTQFEINHRGEVYQGGQMIDRIATYQFEDQKSLERVGSNLYFHNGPDTQISKANKANIQQGMLEGSNVNAIKSMTAMILAHRSYEAYQKAITNYDTMMDRSANSIGDVQA